MLKLTSAHDVGYRSILRDIHMLFVLTAVYTEVANIARHPGELPPEVLLHIEFLENAAGELLTHPDCAAAIKALAANLDLPKDGAIRGYVDSDVPGVLAGIMRSTRELYLPALLEYCSTVGTEHEGEGAVAEREREQAEGRDPDKVTRGEVHIG